MSSEDVRLTNLDEPLFPEADASKRDLVDYLEAVAERFIAELADRPLTVLRVLRGQSPFMQKHLPKYTPSWVRSVNMWAESSHREVRYGLCDDRRTLLWFANQRAVEYHPTLVPLEHWQQPSNLVLDLDPPSEDGFAKAARAATLVRQALRELGLDCAVKTSGAKGVHVFAPITGADHEQLAAATRALAARAQRLDPKLATTAFIREDRGDRVFLDPTRSGQATLIAAYSPRARPGVPVSFPVSWAELEDTDPAAFNLHTAAAAIAERPSWSELLPAPGQLPEALVEEGRQIPVPRVAAMHEGKRRARARRAAESE